MPLTFHAAPRLCASFLTPLGKAWGCKRQWEKTWLSLVLESSGSLIPLSKCLSLDTALRFSFFWRFICKVDGRFRWSHQAISSAYMNCKGEKSTKYIGHTWVRTPLERGSRKRKGKNNKYFIMSPVQASALPFFSLLPTILICTWPLGKEDSKELRWTVINTVYLIQHPFSLSAHLRV